MGKKIGIDLGTTNTVVYCFTESLSPVIIDNEKHSCPSVFCWDGIDWSFGHIAIETAKTTADGAERFYYSIKRFIGRNFEDPEIKKAIKSIPPKVNFANKIIENSTDPMAEIEIEYATGEKITPTELDVEFLKYIKKQAERSLGGEIEGAVITVPAYFSGVQCHATKIAAEKAGLKVIGDLLEEPLAAALSTNVEGITLVVDVGGGTMDTTIIKNTGGITRILAYGGDMWLGGDDIDLAITNIIYKRLAEKEIEIPEKWKSRVHFNLTLKCKEAKESMSRNPDSVTVYVHRAFKVKDGDYIDIEERIAVSDIEDVTAPIAERIIEIALKTLDKQKIPPDQIRNVLCVGGSLKYLQIRAALEKTFGSEKIVEADLMNEVAKGAAGQSLRDAREIIKPTERDYCLRVAKEGESEKFDYPVVISEGTLLPTEYFQGGNFKMSYTGQKKLLLQISSKDNIGIDNVFQFQVLFKDLPDGVRKGEPVKIFLKMESKENLFVKIELPEKKWESREQTFTQETSMGDRAEKALAELEAKVSEAEKELSDKDNERIRAEMKKAEAAVGSEDDKEVLRKVNKAEATFSEITKNADKEETGETPPESISRLNYFCIVLDRALRIYEEVLRPRSRDEIIDFLGKASRILNAKDAEAANSLVENLPSCPKIIFDLSLAEIILENSNVADDLRNRLKELVDKAKVSIKTNTRIEDSLMNDINNMIECVKSLKAKGKGVSIKSTWTGVTR